MILSVGDAVVDVMALGLRALPAWGEDREVQSIERRPGGSALNVAANLAALGDPVALLAAVGDDEWGRFLVESARRLGIESSGMVTLPVRSAVSLVLSGSTDRAFVSVYGATAHFSPEHLSGSLLSRGRHIHVTGLWQNRALQPHLPALFDEWRARGITVSLDPQYDPDDRWGDPLPKLLERVDLFLPSENEAMRITRAGSPEEALETLSERLPLVVMKLGPLGATVARGPERIHHPAFPVEVVDTTGAGDGFNAAFLHGWLQDWPLDRILRFANAAGGLAVARAGASEGAPSEREVWELAERGMFSAAPSPGNSDES